MTRVRVTHVNVKEIMSKLKGATEGIDYSRKSEFQKGMNAGMEGKREYLKKGEKQRKKLCRL